MIRQRMLEQLDNTTTPYALLVIPLMAENNLQTLANRVLVVDVDESSLILKQQERNA